jgi:hypothetical protein
MRQQSELSAVLGYFSNLPIAADGRIPFVCQVSFPRRAFADVDTGKPVLNTEHPVPAGLQDDSSLPPTDFFGKNVDMPFVTVSTAAWQQRDETGIPTQARGACSIFSP